MKIDIYQIDAFTDKLFGGNPAAVCPLENWIDDKLLQQIAIENNLAETAFFIPIEDTTFHLRWFTPEIEMDLCGHATLASAFVIFEKLGYKKETIIFKTLSGQLIVTKNGDFIELDFPARPPVKSVLPKIISDSLNIQPKEVWKARDYLLVYESETDIQNLTPNQSILNQINIDPGGIIITALADADEVDFVSRFFTPQAAVFEDPVTGSAHCTLIPFWSARLNKMDLLARQISQRGGELLCKQKGDRVMMSGKAVQFLKGEIYIEVTE